MSISTDIKFSSNLIVSETVTLTYSGYLFQNNSDSVTVVFGYGDNWENTTEQLMEKKENGFVTDIKVLDYDKFNFCFKNSNNNWDNNFNSNYIVPIEKQEKTNKFIINEDYISDIINCLIENDVSEIVDTIPILEFADEKETPITNNESKNISIEDFLDEDNVDNSTINDIVDTEINNNIENIETSNEDTNETIIDNEINNVFEETNQELTETLNDTTVELIENIDIIEETDNSDSTIDTIIETKVEENNTSSLNFDMNSLVQEVLSPIVTPEVVEESETSQINVYSLIDEILSPMVSSTNFEEEFTETTEQITTEDSSNTILDTIELDDNNPNKENVQKLFELTMGTSATQENGDIQKIIDETEKAIDEIQNIFDSINDSSLEIENYNSDYYIEEAPIVEESTTDIEDTFEPSLIETTKTAKIESLLTAKDSSSEQTALVVSNRTLGAFYRFKKKIKISFFRFFRTLPKLFSQNILNEEK